MSALNPATKINSSLASSLLCINLDDANSIFIAFLLGLSSLKRISMLRFGALRQNLKEQFETLMNIEEPQLAVQDDSLAVR